MKIPTIDDILQSDKKLLLKHFIFFRIFGVLLFLSTPFQIIGEDLDNWWYTTIVIEAVTEVLHALSTKLRWRFSCDLYFIQSMKILINDDIQQSYIKLSLKHFTALWHIEVSIFLSSLFQIIEEIPDNWWYTAIVYKAVAETLHALPTNWSVAFPVISFSRNRWRSWQMINYNNCIKSCYWKTSHSFDQLRCRFSFQLHFK